MTTDSNLLLTELAVPVSTMVSTFPVKTFSLPILNSTQLSFFSILSCFLAGLLLVSRGESHEGQSLGALGALPSSITLSFSSSSSSSSTLAKQGWFRASTAEILSRGFFLSILTKRSRVLASSLWYSSPSKVMLLALFWLRTSLQVLPGKALTPSSRMWKMSPKLKMSQMGSYLVFMSLMLMTSGATYPGVPHRTNKYSSASENSASPKSAMMHSPQLSSERKMRFSGLRSRCMVFLECISLSPWRMEQMMSLDSWGLNLYLALTLSQSCPPSKSSTTMQSEFSDSKISQSFMQHLWQRALMMSISLMRHSLPLSSLQAASFEKALMAQFFPCSNFSARQTEAKLPLPIFFLGLYCSWKPLWLSLLLRLDRTDWRSASALNSYLTFSSCFSKQMVGGLRVKPYLRSKSKGSVVFFLEEVSTMQFSQTWRETSLSETRWAWQLNSSLPVLLVELVHMGAMISIGVIEGLQFFHVRLSINLGSRLSNNDRSPSLNTRLQPPQPPCTPIAPQLALFHTCPHLA